MSQSDEDERDVLIIRSLVSPEPQRPKSLILDNLPGLLGRTPGGGRGGLSPSGARSSEVSPASSGGRPKPPPGLSFVPEVEEIRVSPVISKRGTLSVLDQREKARRTTETSLSRYTYILILHIGTLYTQYF